jgi:hypothetical protein
VAEGEEDTRDRDDRARLADEAEAQVKKQAADIRAAKVPIETEPPVAYRP